MTDPVIPSDPDRPATTSSDQALPPRMPKWVKVAIFVAGGLVVLAIVVMAVSGGQHGPGMHLGAGAGL